MKLELKHLAGYLPYNLKIETHYGWDTMSTLNDWSVNGDCEESYSYETLEETDFKPILRPLSDLTKEIKVNNKKFCFEQWLNESSCPEEYAQYTRCIYKTLSDGSPIDIHYLSYRIIKKMYEHHFDIYGLIDAGLAIDINKLNK